MHIFPYSRRPGTPADQMPEQCTHALKAARAHEAQAVAERMHRDYLAQSVGQTLPVLFETAEEGSVGHSDTYLLVKVPREGLRGQLLDVKITGVEGERLLGEVKSESVRGSQASTAGEQWKEPSVTAWRWRRASPLAGGAYKEKEIEMKKIGMLVAVEMDAVLRRYGTAKRVEKRHGFEMHQYDMGEYELYVLRSGAGEIAAAAAAELLIDRYEVEMIVNFGVVGGLTAEMAQTKTCVVEKVVHYDFDTVEYDHCLPGQYMGYPDEFLRPAPELIDKATAPLPGAQAGDLRLRRTSSWPGKRPRAPCMRAGAPTSARWRPPPWC